MNHSPGNPDDFKATDMRSLQRMASLGAMAAGMAHEIKNALVPVKTFVGLLLAQNKSAEMGQVVERELLRIEFLASQMLKCAGPDNSAHSPVHLQAACRHSLCLLQFQFEDKKIAVEQRWETAADLVQGDAYQLEQIFTNILLNAIEAMQEGGKLTITAENTQAPAESGAATARRMVRVTISDTGIGIPLENLPKLFDTFFTTKSTGTGLGLAITRSIIHQHGGTIEAASAPKQGAVFAICLPVLEGTTG